MSRQIRKLIRAASFLAFAALVCPLPTGVGHVARAQGAVSAPPTDATVAYQVNAEHNGTVSGDSLTLNGLGENWAIDLGDLDGNQGGLVSSPLVVGGAVYVSVSDSQAGANYSLYALNATTGTILWGPTALTGLDPKLSYDGGRIFALERSGALQAFAADTGHLDWSVQLPGSGYTAPTARDGMVYGYGWGSVFAISETDGSTVWTTPIPISKTGSFYLAPGTSGVAVTASGVYFSYSCGGAFDLDPGTGAVIWQYAPAWCGLGLSEVPIVFDGDQYVLSRDPHYVDSDIVAIINAATGSTDGAPTEHCYNADDAAADGSNLICPNVATLSRLSSLTNKLAGPALIINGTVYYTGADGRLYAGDEANLNSILPTFQLPALPDTVDSLPLGAGDGTLVVPDSNWLVAYADGTANQPAPSTVSIPAADATTSEQINTGHNGDLPNDSVTPAGMSRIWERTVGADTSYPLTVDGVVYVVGGSGLYALSAETGDSVWGPVDLGESGPNGNVDDSLAYNQGNVFVASQGGLVRSYHAESGALNWQQQISGDGPGDPSPTAADGILYVNANGGNSLYALSEATGGILWTAPDGGGVPPVLGTNGVDVSDWAGEAFGLDAGTGRATWGTDLNDRSTSFGKEAAIFGGRLYLRESSGESVFDPQSGALESTMPAQPVSFDGKMGYLFSGTFAHPQLEAIDLTTQAVLWTFTLASDGTPNFVTKPVVVNGTVYVAVNDGRSRLYGIDAATGQLVYSVHLTNDLTLQGGPGNSNTGVSAGGGIIVVPANGALEAFTDAPTAVPDAPTNLQIGFWSTAAEVNWSSPLYEGGNDVTSYVVKYSGVGSSGSITVPATEGNNYSTTLEGLKPSTSYEISVAATNVGGTGPAVTSTIVTTPAAQILLDQSETSQTYSSSPAVVTATTKPRKLPYQVKYAGSGSAPKTVGTYSIVAQTTDPRYAAKVHGTLTVLKAPLRVVAANASCTVGKCGHALSALRGAILGVRGSDTITASYVTKATASSPAGTYTITSVVSDSGTGVLRNYHIKQVKGILTIRRAP